MAWREGWNRPVSQKFWSKPANGLFRQMYSTAANEKVGHQQKQVTWTSYKFLSGEVSSAELIPRWNKRLTFIKTQMVHTFITRMLFHWRTSLICLRRNCSVSSTNPAAATPIARADSATCALVSNWCVNYINADCKWQLSEGAQQATQLFTQQHGAFITSICNCSLTKYSSVP